MQFFNRIVFILGALVVAAGGASAHSFSAPAHTTSHVSGRGYAPGHGARRGFFARLFGLHEPSDTLRYETYVYPTAARAFADGTVGTPARAFESAVIQTDEERYRHATGLALPQEHGLVLIPATGPRGDVTYIWPNNEAG